MATVQTPKQIRDAQLAALYTKYQNEVARAANFKATMDSMQIALDNDPEKFSQTRITWNGQLFYRIDLQGYATQNRNLYNDSLALAAQYKIDYEDFFVQAQALDASEFAAANPELGVQLAQTEIEQQTALGIGIAQAEAAAQGNLLQAKGEAEIAAEDAAAKRKIYIIAAVVIGVILLGVAFVWYKNKTKKS